MKFKSEKFMKDLGLEISLQISRDGTMVKDLGHTNVVYLSHSLANSDVAIARAIDNLNATYGIAVVNTTLKKLIE